MPNEESEQSEKVSLYDEYDEYPDDYDLDVDDEEDEEDEDAREWQPGECDMCAGPPSSDEERKAVLASGIVPVCACWLGQGAPLGECQCSPARFDHPEGVKK